MGKIKMMVAVAAVAALTGCSTIQSLHHSLQCTPEWREHYVSKNEELIERKKEIERLDAGRALTAREASMTVLDRRTYIYWAKVKYNEALMYFERDVAYWNKLCVNS